MLSIEKNVVAFLERWITKFSLTHGFAIVLLLVQLFLISPSFFTSLDDINPWDEAAHINKGRMLLDKGDWPIFAENPLVSIFYAIVYIPFRHSINWMAQSCSLGRFILFLLLWVSIYLVARQLIPHCNPLIPLGIFLVSPLCISMLTFPSDPLFASMAGLSLWQLLSFYNNKRLKHLGLASGFLGLAALARNDGLILFPIMVVLSALAKVPTDHWWKNLLSSAIPFLTLVGGYVLFYGLLTGQFNLGIMERTYENFETGQGIIYTGSGDIAPILEGQLESRRVFGTPEENNYSIFKAISRHPDVYWQRLVAFTKALPARILNAYQPRFAAAIFLFALRGIVNLWAKKAYLLLTFLFLWPAHLITAFAITLIRPGHLMFPYYIIFCLAGIGVSAFIANIHNRKEQLFWLAMLSSVFLVGQHSNTLNLAYGAMLLFVGLLAIYVVNTPQLKTSSSNQITLLILFCTGLLIRGNFPSPAYNQLGVSAKEQAVAYLAEHLPPDTLVASATPGPVWAARMTYAGLSALDVPVYKNSTEFLAWMQGQNIEAVYVDHNLYNQNPLVWSLIELQIGQGLERVFLGDEGDILILLVKARR